MRFIMWARSMHQDHGGSDVWWFRAARRLDMPFTLPSTSITCCVLGSPLRNHNLKPAVHQSLLKQANTFSLSKIVAVAMGLSARYLETPGGSDCRTHVACLLALTSVLREYEPVEVDNCMCRLVPS